MITGGERTADVIALTSMRLVRLSREAYERYLREWVEIEQKMALTAARRATNTARKLQDRLD